jgi:hypothetical protein
MSHKALCSLRQKGCSGIIACRYQKCYFLTESERGYKAHQKLVHHATIGQKDVLSDHPDGSTDNTDPSSTLNSVNIISSSSFSNNKQTGGKVYLSCDTCPFSCKLNSSLHSHKLLCLRKLKGDKSILTCEYPDCHFLSSSLVGYKIHLHRSNHLISASCIREVSGSTCIEAKDENAAEKEIIKTQDISINRFEKVVPHLSPEVPVMEEFFSCEKCSYKCSLSDVTQIESHKENCRTQLFDKFKLPFVSAFKIEKSIVETYIEKDEKEDLKKMDTVVFPPKVDYFVSELSARTNLQKSHEIPDLLPVTLAPDPLQPEASDRLDGKLPKENKVLSDSGTSKPTFSISSEINRQETGENSRFAINSILPNNESPEENETFNSGIVEPPPEITALDEPSHDHCNDNFSCEEFNELSLCLDSEYFI